MRTRRVLTLVIIGASVTAAGATPVLAAKSCANSSIVCSTLAAGPNGLSVLTVYAPKSAAITRFDIWTGTKTSDLRPSAFCKQAGKRSGAEYQLADFYLTRCRETIKAGRSRAYCYKGGGGIPFLRGAAINAVSIEAGSAGQDTVNAIGNATKCPNSVTQRKKPKKR